MRKLSRGIFRQSDTLLMSLICFLHETSFHTCLWIIKVVKGWGYWGGGEGDGSGGVAGWKTCVSISAIYLHPYGTNRGKCWKIGKLGKVEGGGEGMSGRRRRNSMARDEKPNSRMLGKRIIRFKRGKSALCHPTPQPLSSLQE
jgi:hypothetical protein